MSAGTAGLCLALAPLVVAFVLMILVNPSCQQPLHGRTARTLYIAKVTLMQSAWLIGKANGCCFHALLCCLLSSAS